MLCAPGPLQKQEAGQCRSQQKGICQEGGLPPKPAGDETGTYPAQEGPEHGSRGIDGHGPLQGLLPAVQGDVRHQGQQDGRDQQPGQGAQGQQLPEGRRKRGCQQDKSAQGCGQLQKTAGTAQVGDIAIADRRQPQRQDCQRHKQTGRLAADPEMLLDDRQQRLGTIKSGKGRKGRPEQDKEFHLAQAGGR